MKASATTAAMRYRERMNPPRLLSSAPLSRSARGAGATGSIEVEGPHGDGPQHGARSEAEVVTHLADRLLALVALGEAQLAPGLTVSVDQFQYDVIRGLACP